MKPVPFCYFDPVSLDEVLDLLNEHGDAASLLAGGQSLIPLLNLRLARPEVVIDINRVADLDNVIVTEEEARLGALVRASQLRRDPSLRNSLPVVSEAVGHVGHPQIRCRTTVGGNLAHADPASELPAVLAALQGDIVLRSRGGQRVVGWERFFQGPYMTCRRPDEMVVGVHIPVTREMRFGFLEFARRHGDYALAGVCIGIRRCKGIVEEARIALLGVSGTPVRAYRVEEAVVGKSIDRDLEDVAALVEEDLDPPKDIHASAEYRRHLAATLTVRLLAGVWAEEEG